MGKRQRLDPESDSDADYIQVRDPPLERTVDFYKSVQVREESVACEQQALDRLRQPLNLWTDAQRLALLILRDYLDLNWRDVTRIFNLAFCKELATRGFFQPGVRSDGITIKALQSQWFELHDTRHAYGASVINVLMSINKLSDLQSPWQETFRSIAFTASTLGFEVNRSSRIDKSKFSIKRSLNRVAWRSSQTHRMADIDESDKNENDGCDSDIIIVKAAKDLRSKSNEHAFSGNKAEQVRSMKSARLVSNLTSQSARRPQLQAFTLELTSHDEIPSILFRAYSPTSAGQNSGREFWSALQVYEPHPGWEDHAILAHAINHLNRTKTPTPFISLTSSFIWAVQLAKKYGKGARVAIIEPRAIYPTVYGIAPICAKVKASGHANFVGRTGRGYNGDFEYWAWLHIPSHAILADKSIEELTSFTSSPLATRLFGQIDHRLCRTIQEACKLLSKGQTAGQIASAVGSMIKVFFPVGVAEHYTRDMVRNCIQCFNLWPDMDNWQSNQEFCDILEVIIGVRLGTSACRNVYNGQALDEGSSGKGGVVGTTVASKATATVRERPLTSPAMNSDLAIELGMLSPVVTPCRKADHLGSVLQDLLTPLSGSDDDYDQSGEAAHGTDTIWNTIFRRRTSSPLPPVISPSMSPSPRCSLADHPLNKPSSIDDLSITLATPRGPKSTPSSIPLILPNTDSCELFISPRLSHPVMPTKKRLIAVVVPKTPREISRSPRFERPPNRQYTKAGADSHTIDKQHYRGQAYRSLIHEQGSPLAGQSQLQEYTKQAQDCFGDGSVTNATCEYPAHIKLRDMTLGDLAAIAASETNSFSDDSDSFEGSARRRSRPETRGGNVKRVPDYLSWGSPYALR